MLAAPGRPVYPQDAMTALSRRRFTATLALGLALGAVPPAMAQSSLHLVLTPSQKPTDLMATGEEFGQVLGKLAGVPVRVTVASDYAAVIEALRNRTADLAFVHPGGYVLASREAKARIVAKNVWHGKSSFTARIYVRRESGIKSRPLGASCIPRATPRRKAGAVGSVN